MAKAEGKLGAAAAFPQPGDERANVCGSKGGRNSRLAAEVAVLQEVEGL